jgi:4-amino-4-deoxy-L-arabinose transferase-like glycosyltransferase
MTTRHQITAQNRGQIWLPTAIILAGFALRLAGLGRQSLWYDETVSAFLAALSPADLIAHTARDIHPPGYYLLLHFWSLISGNSELALAYFSAFFGTLLIPLSYVLAKILLNRNTAGWAAFLVAISPFHIWYSQEVRMYTLGATCGLLVTICGVLALRGRSRCWLGYITAAAVGLYALYYFSFLLIVLNLWFLFAVLKPKVRTQPLTYFVGANVIVLILYLPWLPTAWRQATNPPVPPWRTPPSAALVATESWTALSLGQSVEPAQVWPLLLLTLALLALGLMSMPRQTAALLAGYTFGPLLLIVALSTITPLYHVRYVFTYAAGFNILLAAGLYYLATRTHRWLAAGIALILLAGSLFSIYQLHTNPRYQADDFRAAVRFIDEQRQPGDALLVNAGYTYTAFNYYTNIPDLQRQRLVPYPESAGDHPTLLQTGTVNGSPGLGWGDPRADFYPMSAADTIAALEQLAGDYPRLWLLRAYDTVTDPTGLIRAWLAENAIPLEDQPFAGPSNIRAQGFLLTPPPPPQMPAVPFDDGLVLQAWHLPVQSWQAGQTIPLKFWWTTTSPPAADYKMSLKLWTPAGELAAQGRDRWPGGSLFRASAWPAGQIVYQPDAISLPPDLPPGEYWLNVELYHPDTVQPLARLDDSSTVVTLGPVWVDPPPN